MFNRTKGWLPSLLSKPKNPHSLDHLKYLYNILCKNQIVTDHNRGLLVETLRSISEILIWGDQNDSSVFDFFLEKNMLSFFLRYLRQKSGRFICVQLLQTLNILFDNISNETSLYYLLSNNHINSIIVHKFDFSDEEVMAYYISFLKTLSLKLNKHTIHFFYNEHTNDFALYTEAIKFFNHSEGMVRIAVRTITLNVYKVKDQAMLRYIRDRTAAPYFSNLVWFIGSHILDLNICVRNDADHQSRGRLSTLVAEHLDHLHYVNDILSINIDTLNDVLSDQLLNRLLIPLYVYSLTKRKKYEARQGDKKHVSSVVSLFLLSQVFLIIRHSPLVRQLAEIIFQGEINVALQGTSSDSPRMQVREFVAPEESLEEILDSGRGMERPRNESVRVQEESETAGTDDVFTEDMDVTSPSQNSTDEEKLLSSLGPPVVRRTTPVTVDQTQSTFSLENRPYLESIFHALECTENDYEALFALCLLYAMGHNDGIHQGLMDTVFMPTERSETKDFYNVALVERLIRIITLACQHGSKVRLATLELTIRLLKQLVYKPGKSYLQDRHLACVENARECSTQLLRNFYKSEEIFLDMYEDEFQEMKTRPLNVEYLTMDASILLPPTGTPLTGIDFNKRLPCGEVERARRAIRVFFLVRDLSLTLMQEEETKLPLTKDKDCVKIDNILDLNNSDLIACTVVLKDRKQERRFLVIDALQMILVEPDTRRLGWGIVRFVGFLQNIEVTGDKEDSRSLHITVHKPASSHHVRPVPLLAGRFIFDDHIRCMAAKQRLSKGRLKARQQKMAMIEKLLDIPSDPGSAPTGRFSRTGPIPGRSHPVRVSSSSSVSESTPTPSGSQSAVASHLTQPQESRSQQGTSPVAGTSGGKKPGQTVPPGERMQQPITVEDKNSSAVVDDLADGEIELAEEATSEMAFQTLHQCPSGSSTPSRHSPGSHESSPQPQDIPLEDLSRKSKSKRKQQLTRARITQSRLSAELKQQEPSRSHSQSPRRKNSDGTLSKVVKARGRSASLTTDGSESRSRSGTPEKRAHSKSVPAPASAGRTKTKHSSFKKTDAATVTDPQLISRDVKPADTATPKTLCPASSPALSLIKEAEKDVVSPLMEDAPKLMPPTEVDRIRSLSDVSAASSDSELSSMGSTNTTDQTDRTDQPVTEGPEKPDFGFHVHGQAQAELSKASAVVSVGKGKRHSASDQLTKLAQMVQEHYKYEGRSHPVRVSSSSSVSESTPTPSGSQSAVASHLTQPQESRSQQGTSPVAGTSGGKKPGQTVPPGERMQQPITVEDKNSSAVVDDMADGEIELAEEATSEMAFQTLHQCPSGSSTPSRHSPGSHESSPQPQDIPLEDLSRKNKSKRKQQLTRARITQSRLSAELKQQEPSRSHSQSPRRKNSDRTLSKVVKARGRSASLTTDGSESRSRSGTPEKRAHSKSVPAPASAGRTKTKHSSFKKADAATVTDPQLISQDVKPADTATPKTLCPASSPALSLIKEAEKDVVSPLMEDAPKLMPPTEVDRIRSLSDVSAASSDSELSSMGSTNTTDQTDRPVTEGPEKPDFGFHVHGQAQAELSKASAVVSVGKGKRHSASDQLTKLAQMVQEHYKYEGEGDLPKSEGQGQQEVSE